MLWPQGDVQQEVLEHIRVEGVAVLQDFMRTHPGCPPGVALKVQTIAHCLKGMCLLSTRLLSSNSKDEVFTELSNTCWSQV